MNRRDILKIGSACSVAAFAKSASAALPIPTHPVDSEAVPRWEVFERTLAGPSGGNPYVDVQLGAAFSLGHRSVAVDGFYDGNGQYKIRFMPDTEGAWSYATTSNVPELDGKTGSFHCAAALEGVHGPVRVRNLSHFAYEDGTPYFPFGTTCYAWVHQSEEMQQRTLATLRNAPFNKIRMCVFPKHYEYNHNEPPLYPFERDATGKHDFTRPNPAYFAHLEKRIGDLRALGIEADVILFHPYDNWGYSTMPSEADDRYLKYVVARMSAYRNIWWSMANEFDLMKGKSIADFDRFFHIVEQHDPAGHLRSIHCARIIYDYAHPWVTHVCMQSSAFDQAAEWRDRLRKPLVWDEVGYEGNLNRRWGNLSSEEETRRVWMGVVSGGYVTHGETLLRDTDALDEDTTPELWWARGGELRGTSYKRIGFLRKLVEETTENNAKRSGLTTQAGAYYLNASILDEDGETTRQILYYMDAHQPLWYEFPLPDGRFTAELIDPWEMKIVKLDGTFEGKSKIRLTGRPYQALRFRRVS